MIGVHAQHIVLGGTFERHFDITDAVDAVGRHPGKEHVRSNRPLDHAERQRRLGDEAGIVRQIRPGQTLGVVRPGLRQIERPGQ